MPIRESDDKGPLLFGLPREEVVGWERRERNSAGRRLGRLGTGWRFGRVAGRGGVCAN